ncbi:hypothetical protein ACLM45_06040 [Synechococcus sp. A10-1-5-9]|uniref:hypothetical protein n=1 Tax=Synechococcus sp. A10-1-5-9 TaxID=3392295 RepID=UPI0039E91891
MPETFVGQPIPWLTVSCDPFRISDGVRHRRPDPRGLVSSWEEAEVHRQLELLVAMLCLVHGLLLVLSERLTYLGLVLMGSAAGINQTASNTGSPLKTLYVLRHGLNQGITMRAQLSQLLVQNMLKLIPLTSLGLLIGRRTCLDALSLVIETFRET